MYDEVDVSGDGGDVFKGDEEGEAIKYNSEDCVYGGRPLWDEDSIAMGLCCWTDVVRSVRTSNFCGCGSGNLRIV